MAGVIRWGGVAAMAMLLGGCVVIPLSSEHTAPPTVVPLLPEDVQSSDREVMVLAQSWVRGGYVFTNEGDIISAPVFARGSALDAAIHQFDLETIMNSFYAWSVGFGTGGMGTNTVVGQRLGRLCMVTADGQQLTLSPWAGVWKAQAPSRVHTERRDMMVSALRAGGDNPFDKVDGPCGIRGKVEWTTEARLKAIEFISRLPATEPGNEYPQLAAILNRVRPEPERGSAMLLAASQWSMESVENSPVFLSAPDYQQFRAITASTNARDIVALLPSVQSSYTTGRRALENLSVEHLCVIGSNGEIMVWKKPADASARIDIGSHAATWLREALARLAGDGGTRDWDDACMPGGPQSWSERDLRGLTAFLKNALSAALPPRASGLRTTQLLREGLIPVNADADPATAAGLFLAVTFKSDHHWIVPLFIRSGHDLAAFVDTLTSTEPGSVLPTLSEISSGAVTTAFDQVCVIGASGQFFDLSAFKTGVWLSRTGPLPETVSDSFRSEVLNALREDKQGYMGSYVCSLQGARWPEEVRTKVTTFLRRVTVSAGNVPKVRQ